MSHDSTMQAEEPFAPGLLDVDAALVRAYAEQAAAYHDVARRLHLSDSAFGILYDLSLAPEEGLSQASLCATNVLSKQTVNSSVGRLKEDGLVQTRQEGRKSLVSLTPAGHALVEERIGPVRQAERVALSALTPEERVQFVQLYIKYNNALAVAFKEL